MSDPRMTALLSSIEGGLDEFKTFAQRLKNLEDVVAPLLGVLAPAPAAAVEAGTEAAIDAASGAESVVKAVAGDLGDTAAPAAKAAAPAAKPATATQASSGIIAQFLAKL